MAKNPTSAKATASGGRCANSTTTPSTIPHSAMPISPPGSGTCTIPITPDSAIITGKATGSSHSAGLPRIPPHNPTEIIATTWSSPEIGCSRPDSRPPGTPPVWARAGTAARQRVAVRWREGQRCASGCSFVCERVRVQLSRSTGSRRVESHPAPRKSRGSGGGTTPACAIRSVAGCAASSLPVAWAARSRSTAFSISCCGAQFNCAGVSARAGSPAMSRKHISLRAHVRSARG